MEVSLHGARLSVCLLVLAAWAGIAGAQSGSDLQPEERVVITDTGVSKIRLVFEDFLRGTGTTVGDVRSVQNVTATDLDYSGYFTLFAIPRMAAGDTLGALPAQALVRGEVRIAAGEIVLRGSLESLPARALIFGREYRTSPENFREAAHRFADDIVLYLTGEAGISRTRIAFISDRGGHKEVFVVDYDGNGPRPVTRNGTINLSPDWSPDGSTLTYVSYKGGDPDLYTVDLAGSKERLLIGGKGVQGAPAYSPDGSLVAYGNTEGGQSEIYVSDLSGRNRRRVARSSGINTSPTWSPDARRLAFTSDRSGTPQVYVMEADGTGLRRMTFEGKWNDQADWSPKGDRLVYASRRDGLFRICVVDASGLGGERQITRGPGSDEHPRWAPDGRHVVFSSTRGGAKGLYVLDVDNGVVRSLLTGGGNNSAPAWSSVPAR
jgi:TolB protein